MTKLRLWFFVLKHFWKTEIIVHGTSYQRETCTRFFRILSRTRKSGGGVRALARARCKVPRGRWASCAPQLLPRRSAGPRPAEPEPPRSVPGSSLAGPGSVCCAGRVERGAPTGWRAQTPWVLAPGGFQPLPPALRSRVPPAFEEQN